MLKEGATLPFQMIKISCINIAYKISCDLRERWSHRHGRTCHGRTKSTQLYIFCFLLVSVHINTVWLFLIFPKPLSPLLDHFWVLICIENPFVEYGIFFTFELLRFTYTIWFLKASNLDFISLNANNLAKKPFFLVFYQYPISMFDAVWVDR